MGICLGLYAGFAEFEGICAIERVGEFAETAGAGFAEFAEFTEFTEFTEFNRGNARNLAIWAKSIKVKLRGIRILREPKAFRSDSRIPAQLGLENAGASASYPRNWLRWAGKLEIAHYGFQNAARGATLDIWLLARRNAKS